MAFNPKSAKNDTKIVKNVVESYCRASQPTIVFSFKKMVENEQYNFAYFNKYQSELETLLQLQKKMKEISQQTFDQIIGMRKKSGCELLKISDLKDKALQNAIKDKITLEQRLYIVRFNSQKCRMIGYRGTKCGRVFNVLALDFKLTAYKH